jgi:hypothetical protein
VNGFGLMKLGKLFLIYCHAYTIVCKSFLEYKFENWQVKDWKDKFYCISVLCFLISSLNLKVLLWEDFNMEQIFCLGYWKISLINLWSSSLFVICNWCYIRCSCHFLFDLLFSKLILRLLLLWVWGRLLQYRS